MSGQWPAWDSNDPLGLVPYVSVPAAVEADLQTPDRLLNADADQARRVAASVYEVLRDRQIPYAHEPWDPGDRQLIRSPQEFVQTAGTCVDLAVAYAALCVQAQLRPLLALGSRGGSKHVFVVIDLDACLSHYIVEQGDPLVPAAQGGDSAGLYQIKRGGRTERLLAVDIARAAVHGGKQDDFAEAVRSGAAWLRHASGLRLVDVVHARSAGGSAELAPPDPKFWPPIHSRIVRPAGDYQRYPSRAAVEQQLQDGAGRVVIHGESGLGKSMLAYTAAAAAEHGYGWFLTASDQATLVSSLAEAERAERPESQESFDRVAFADAALDRLHRTRAPWVVILDNADCDPRDLGRYLPRPGLGQTLIATTTAPNWLEGQTAVGRPAWAKGADVQQVRLEALTDAEAPSGLPDWVLPLLAGSPLLGNALAKALAAGGDAGPQRAGTDPVALVWDTAFALLDPQAKNAARLLAWAPAAGLDEDHFASLEIDLDAQERLIAVGLAGRDGEGRIQMHRLLRGHGRTTGGPDGLAAVIRLLSEPGLHQHLFRAADESLLDDARSMLPADGAAPAWLGLGRVWEYRGKVEAASGYFAAALDADRGTLTAADRADCLQGRARWVFQNAKAAPDDLEDGLAWLNQLRADLDPGSDEDELRRLRADAMDALLRRKQIAPTIGDDPDGAREVLLRVREDLQQTLDERSALLRRMGRSDLDDIDRGLFNIAGVDLLLAKCGKGSEARPFHQAARERYREVRDIRTRRYGNVPIPHIASCVAGEGTNDYNEALSSLAGIPRQEALDAAAQEAMTGLLRSATNNSVRGLTERQTVEGPTDLSDTEKSLNVLIKVLLLRKALRTDPADPGSQQSLEAIEKLVAGFAKELRQSRDRRE